MKTILTVIAALLVYAPTAASQHSGHGSGPPAQHDRPAPRARGTAAMPMAMPCPSMMMVDPAAVLRRSQELGMSAEQVRSIESLASADSLFAGHHRAAMQRHRAIADLMRAPEPDLSSVERVMREAADHMVQAHLAAARRSLAVRALLSPRQWEALRAAEEANPCPMMMGHDERQGAHQHRR